MRLAVADQLQHSGFNAQPYLPDEATKVLRSVRAPKSGFGLTKREVECLTWCGRGRTNAQIGKTLSLSARTVEHYLASAIRKLGAKNRTEAVYKASLAGILKPP